MAVNHGFNRENSDNDIPDFFRTLTAKSSFRIEFDKHELDDHHDKNHAITCETKISKNKGGNLKKLHSKIGFVKPVGDDRATTPESDTDKEPKNDKDTVPPPLKYCIFIAKYPIIAFCKYKI